MDEGAVVAGHTSDTKIWRVTRAGRIGGSALGTCWLALVAGITAGGGVASEAIALLWITLGLVIVRHLAIGVYPVCCPHSRSCDCSEPVDHASVPYAEIAEGKAGFYGLRLVTKDHDIVTAWAVQKSNASKWAHKKHTGP